MVEGKDGNKVTQQVIVNPDYHDDYVCPEGQHCIGELRHELFVNPIGEPLPNHSPITFLLAHGDYELPLTIGVFGVSQEKGEMLLVPKTDEDSTLSTKADIACATPGFYVDKDASPWIRTQEKTWVNASGEVLHDDNPVLLEVELTLWKVVVYP